MWAAPWYDAWSEGNLLNCENELGEKSAIGLSKMVVGLVCLMLYVLYSM